MVLLFLRLLLVASPRPVPVPSIQQISVIANALRDELQLSSDIRITVVPTNERMVSVEHVGTKFVMCFDQQFLASLEPEELNAAIAHELGHVWIFSHHPYLHTEALANQIAMRVVSRESLQKIYTKLWAHVGTKGSLEEFLGN